MEGKKKICVKVYLNDKSFAEIAEQAEKAGKRRGGLALFTQKPHGFAGEVVSNTDGISRFLKYCAEYYKEHEADRLNEIAKVKAEEQELNKRKAKLGIAET